MHNQKWQAEFSRHLLYRQSISHCTRMLNCFLQPQDVSILGEYSKFPSSHFSLITDLSQRRLLVPVPNDTTCSNKKRLFGQRSKGLLFFLPTDLALTLFHSYLKGLLSLSQMTAAKGYVLRTLVKEKVWTQTQLVQ